MPGANDTSQKEALDAALKAEEAKVSEANDQSKGNLTEEKKASKENAEPEVKEESADEEAGDTKEEEGGDKGEKPEEEALQLKPAEIQVKVQEGISEYLKTPEFAKAVQSAKDKEIAKVTKPLQEKVTELEKTAALADLKVQDAKELEDILATFQSGDETKIKQLVTDNQAQRQRLTSIAKQADQGLMIYNAYLLSQENNLSLNDLLNTNPTSPDDLKEKVQEMVSGKSDKAVQEKADEINRLKDEIAELKKNPLTPDGPVKPGGGNVKDLKGSDAIAEGLRREAAKRAK